MWSAPSVVARAGVATLIVVAFACAPAPPSKPRHMKAIELGTAVDPEGKITAPTRKFSPQSKVYASITTEGGGPATFHVRWYGNSQLLTEQSKSVDPEGPAYVAFEFTPPNGWPPGKSGVVFWMNDEEKHTAEFEVG